jgi:hypothetical protein
VPSQYSASSQQANPDFPQEMEKMRSDLQGGRAVLVYLRRYEKKRWYFPDADQVKVDFDLTMLKHERDGNICANIPPARRTTSARALGGRTKEQRKAEAAAAAAAAAAATKR